MIVWFNRNEMNHNESTFAVIGLGLMGSRMAKCLIDSGFRLRGFDPDPACVTRFVELGGEAATSPADAVAGCWGALLSLPNSDIAREVCLGSDGLIESGVPNLYVYDTTTGRPSDAEDFATQLAGAGIIYSDSTVSGNGEVAGRGELVVMVGGSAEAYHKGVAVFEAIGRAHHHVGGSGAGSRMKLLVNHLLTIHRMALAEGLVVAELSGMDMALALHVLKDGLAYSRAMDAWGERMISGDHLEPFARLRQSHKDARLIVENGEGLAAPIDLVSVVRAAMAEGEEAGLADMDNSAIMEVVRRRAGIGRVPH